MHAASIGRIADRAGDVGAVRDMTDAGRHGRGGAARRAARRERGIARIARIAVQLVAGEPAQRKRRRVGATEHHRAGAQQVVDDRVVGLGDHVLLQRHAIGGGIAGLVHIDLHRDRHAGQRAGVFAARQPLVQGGGLRQRILGSMIDHGVDAELTASSRASALCAPCTADTSRLRIRLASSAADRRQSSDTRDSWWMGSSDKTGASTLAPLARGHKRRSQQARARSGLIPARTPRRWHRPRRAPARSGSRSPCITSHRS